MTKRLPSLNIDTFYKEATQLRHEYKILRKKLSLADAKVMIATQHGFSSWADLRQAIDEQIQIRVEAFGNFIPEDNVFEAGDVVKNDVVFIGEKNKSKFAVDMILETVFELTPDKEGYGFLMRSSEKSLAEGSLPDPDDFSDWNLWAESVLNKLY